MGIEFKRSIKARAFAKRWALLIVFALFAAGSYALALESKVKAFSARAGGTLIAAAGDVSWGTDLSRGLSQARSGNKYVLADVYTDWCGYCKRLDRETFENPAMMSYLNQKFVCVKVNAEQGDGREVASRYKVNGFPCALVFDKTGKFIGKISGYRPADPYKNALEQLIKNPPADPYAED